MVCKISNRIADKTNTQETKHHYLEWDKDNDKKRLVLITMKKYDLLHIFGVKIRYARHIIDTNTDHNIME